MDEQSTTKQASVPFEYATGELTISVNVSDLDRSIRWYQDALGFEVAYRMDDMGWCELTTPFGPVHIGLSQTEEQRAGGTVPTFGVEDIDSARRHFEGLGVRTDDVFDVQGVVRLMGFYDPDGNPWMLSQMIGPMPGS